VESKGAGCARPGSAHMHPKIPKPGHATHADNEPESKGSSARAKRCVSCALPVCRRQVDLPSRVTCSLYAAALETSVRATVVLRCSANAASNAVSIKGLQTEAYAAVQAESGVRDCSACLRDDRDFADEDALTCNHCREQCLQYKSKRKSDMVCLSRPACLQAPDVSAVSGDLVAGAECMSLVGSA
jgi:hypothetical protein